MNLSARLVQSNPVTGAIAENEAHVLDAFSRARRDGVDLVVFPEMVLTGYCILDLVEDDSFVDVNLAALDRVAAATGDSGGVRGIDADTASRDHATAAVVGFVDREGDDRYKAAAVCQGGEVVGVARKVLLPNYRYFDDARYFSAGEAVSPIEIATPGGPVSLGLSVCEDMWDAEYDRRPVRELADAGADLLVNVTASPFETAKRRERDRIVRDHVAATGLPFLYCNTAGAADVGKNVIVFDGDSLAYDDRGALLARGGQFETDEVTVEVGVGTGRSSPPSTTAPDESSAGEDARATEVEPREKELYEALVLGLREYVEKTGFETVIESVSGGIDSSLGLAICVDAVGPDRVVAYNLPSAVNTETTKGIAAELAGNLAVDYRVLPMQSVADAAIDAYESHVGPVERAVSRENVSARVRGLLLMLASNDAPPEASALLVSNGNETEMALGYVTLYGDMSGGLDLLGDLSKTDVYDLARYVNERHGREIIPQAAFDIAPSAELASGQEDPFDYGVVAPVVTDFLERRTSPTELVRRFADGELDPARYRSDDGETASERYDVAAFRGLVRDVYGRLTRSTFKRVQSSPIVAVSPRAFGLDFREPIINGWDGGAALHDDATDGGGT